MTIAGYMTLGPVARTGSVSGSSISGPGLCSALVAWGSGSTEEGASGVSTGVWSTGESSGIQSRHSGLPKCDADAPLEGALHPWQLDLDVAVVVGQPNTLRVDLARQVNCS